MICEIISVGTEVVMGDIIDTNAPYLSKELVSLGIDTMYRTSVKDDDKTILEVLNIAKKRADLIITIGGLGPTYDDFTKEEVAKVNGLKLVRSDKAEQKIRDYFDKTGRKMTDNNLRQADIIEGSLAIDNDNGTAPGILLEKDNKIFILFPGPPNELIPMFENKVKPYLKDKTGKCILERCIKLSGIGESYVEEELKDLIDKDEKIIIATYAKVGEVHIKITSEGKTKQEAEEKMKPYFEKIEIRFSKYVYGYDDDTLPKKVVEYLKDKNLKVAFCESCTGGYISKTITDVPGASDVFDCGMVTYSNEIKTRLAGVSPIALKNNGAVSEEVATQMAKGIRTLAKADIGISVTGIAGPGGGTEEKPVGLVYMGISTKNTTVTKKLNFRGNREKIRLSTVNAVMSTLIEYLK
ncbi:MAG: competence/damage-inducible protein A [Ruminococcaceae bacterium]|nr:competence/damage-inducible protein A [Oscillospiraceae bacterium]